jgi:hypothetical protein
MGRLLANGYASARRLKKANKTESFFEGAMLNLAYDQQVLKNEYFVQNKQNGHTSQCQRLTRHEQARRCSTTLQ